MHTSHIAQTKYTKNSKALLVFLIAIIALSTVVPSFAQSIGSFNNAFGNSQNAVPTATSVPSIPADSVSFSDNGFMIKDKDGSSSKNGSSGISSSSAAERSLDSSVDEMFSAMSNLTGLFTSAISVIISLVFTIFSLVARGKMLSKAGENGWLILVPFYGRYLEYKKYWKTKRYWVMFAIGVTAIVLFFVGIVGVTIAGRNDGQTVPLGIALITFGIVLPFILTIVVLVFNFIFRMNTMASFGKSKALALLDLVGCGSIIDMVIAFSKDEYVGPGYLQ